MTSSFHYPELAQVQALICQDSAANLWEHWGYSTVVDELTESPLVATDIFELLHQTAQLPHTYPIGNAGLIHVYAYHFAPARTPFGFKRDRWLDGQLARAFGLPPHAFHLDAELPGTPLARVTAAMKDILHHPPATARVLTEHCAGVVAHTVITAADAAVPATVVHAVDYGNGPQLITTFPIHGSVSKFVHQINAAGSRLRWNAALPPA